MCIGPVRSNCHPWTGPIGRSSLFLDRSRFGSVQVHSSVGPVRLHLQNCRSCTLDRTEPRPNRCCPSLRSISHPVFWVLVYLIFQSTVCISYYQSILLETALSSNVVIYLHLLYPELA